MGLTGRRAVVSEWLLCGRRPSPTTHSPKELALEWLAASLLHGLKSSTRGMAKSDTRNP
jgi:hypothetical protein